MEMNKRDADGVAVVELRGNLDTNTSPAAEAEFNALVAEGAEKLLINMTSIDYVSSAGLRILLATAKRLKSAGGELRVCGLSETVREVFEISGFDLILKLYADESDALAGF